MSTTLYVDYFLKEPINFNDLNNIFSKLINNFRYVHTTSWKSWKNSKISPNETSKIVWNEGGSVLFSDFSISFSTKHSNTQLTLSFELLSSLISGEDKEKLERIIESIILIANEFPLKSIISYFDSLGIEKSHHWVWYFPKKNIQLFDDWTKGKIIQLMDGVLVFVAKSHVASIQDHKEFIDYLKKNHIDVSRIVK